MAADILLADDDKALRQGFSRLLEAEGYSVRTARDGKEALALYAERRPDLLLVDIDMPALNGFVVCERLRENDPLLPIIFLTANASEANEVKAFTCGCDDFYDKADNPQILFVRIRRALKRSDDTDRLPGVISVGPVTVDLASMEVIDRQERRRLTETECDILRVLSTYRGEWLSKDRLLQALRGDGCECVESMLFSHISRLRSKLGPGRDAILSWRSNGYCLKRG